MENTASGLAAPWSLPFTFIENAVSITNVSDNVGAVTGTVASGGISDDTTPTLTGTLSATLGAGEKVSIYDGATKLGEATVLGTSWTYTHATDLANGAHSFTAKIENSTDTAEIASNSYSINTFGGPVGLMQSVSITEVNDNVGVQQGGLTSGQSTDDTVLTLTGTINAALLIDDTLVVYDNGAKIGTATVTGTDWTYTTSALGAGAHDLAARVEKAFSGAAGEFATFKVIENTVSITNVTDDAGAVVGNVASGSLTDDTTPTLTGTLSATLGAGEKVSIYDGATKLGEATVTGTNWNYTPTALADGTHCFHGQDRKLNRHRRNCLKLL